MWLVYEVLLLIAFLLYLPSALWRRRLPHAGWSMRLGRYPRGVIDALRGRRSLWVHAVSVGEVLAAQPLVRALANACPDEPLVLSTVTSGGYEVASKQLGDRGVPMYLPLDLRWCVTRALDTVSPRMLLLVEAELWPTLIRLAKTRGVAIAVVNGRISARAFRRYRWIKPATAAMLRHVDLLLMQSQVDADRVIALGASPGIVRVTGNLKWDASLGARPSPQAIQQQAARLGLNEHTPLIVAGSTHPGEEELVFQAFCALRSSHEGLRLVLAPRHLERLAEVEGLVRRTGLTIRHLSQPDAGSPWDVGLVDTFGQLPFYYGLATVVFIGGSLIPHGGQNPLEAASLGKPITFGPFMHNFETIVHQLLAHHAARQLTGGEQLAGLFQELLAHPTEAQEMGRRAQALTEQFHGATQRTLEALRLLLEPTWPKGYG